MIILQILYDPSSKQKTTSKKFATLAAKAFHVCSISVLFGTKKVVL
jgi:hypothetical protein